MLLPLQSTQPASALTRLLIGRRNVDTPPDLEDVVITRQPSFNRFGGGIGQSGGGMGAPTGSGADTSGAVALVVSVYIACESLPGTHAPLKLKLRGSMTIEQAIDAIISLVLFFTFICLPVLLFCSVVQ